MQGKLLFPQKRKKKPKNHKFKPSIAVALTFIYLFYYSCHSHKKPQTFIWKVIKKYFRNAAI